MTGVEENFPVPCLEKSEIDHVNDDKQRNKFAIPGSFGIFGTFGISKISIVQQEQDFQNLPNL